MLVVIRLDDIEETLLTIYSTLSEKQNVCDALQCEIDYNGFDWSI